MATLESQQTWLPPCRDLINSLPTSTDLPIEVLVLPGICYDNTIPSMQGKKRPSPTPVGCYHDSMAPIPFMNAFSYPLVISINEKYKIDVMLEERLRGWTFGELKQWLADFPPYHKMLYVEQEQERQAKKDSNPIAPALHLGSVNRLPEATIRHNECECERRARQQLYHEMMFPLLSNAACEYAERYLPALRESLNHKHPKNKKNANLVMTKDEVEVAVYIDKKLSDILNATKDRIIDDWGKALDTYQKSRPQITPEQRDPAAKKHRIKRLPYRSHRQ